MQIGMHTYIIKLSLMPPGKLETKLKYNCIKLNVEIGVEYS